MAIGIIIVSFIIMLYFMAYRWDVKKGSIKWSDFLLVPVGAIELFVFNLIEEKIEKKIFIVLIILLNLFLLITQFYKKRKIS